jgi:phosphatidylglycerophosphatase A
VGALLLVWLLGTSHPLLFPGIAALLFFLGVYASGCIQKETGIADHGIIVIDEVVGIFLTFTWVPITPLNCCLGFFLFRFFDIFKLPPASTVDRRLKNGWGVMLDDVFAGVYANLCLQVLRIMVS